MRMEKISIEEIEFALEQKIRPELSLHGGNIRIEKLENNILYVRLTGQCCGCPLAGLTLEQLVHEQLTKQFVQLEKVVLAEGVSDGLLEQARELLKRRK